MLLDLNLAKSRSGIDVHKNLEFQIPSDVIDDLGFKTQSPCNISISYQYNSDFVLVKGQGSVYLTGNCFRCGDEVKLLHTFKFEEKFLPANDKDINNCYDQYFYKGNVIDITKMIIDNLLTSLPHQVLCKEDCKGLCPQCFANLNFQTCECKKQINNAFTSLIDINYD